MKINYTLLIKISLIAMALQGCARKKNAILYSGLEEKELRGVWIASVENIDWPKQHSLSGDLHLKSFNDILDFYKKNHFNAVFVQIRTAGDALYASQLTPWSRYLSGKEGHSIDRDILPEMIQACHDRGIEFHAWINPYRATMTLDTLSLARSHAFYLNPEWMIKYGKKYYFDPGNESVENHLLEVITEITEKYAIDGIHFDDYFYPYKIANEIFDDKKSFEKRKDKNQDINDWRRANINHFIAQCHKTIKGLKPYVAFGVSPFGVWRNISADSTGSDTKAGQTVYDDLYADTRHWIKNKTIDYLAPQLYWSIDHPLASYKTLAHWWSNEIENIPLYLGLGFYKVQNNADTAWLDINQIPQQITILRNEKKPSGFISFSAKSLIQKPELEHALQNTILQNISITPSQLNWAENQIHYQFKEISSNQNKVIELETDENIPSTTLYLEYYRKRFFSKKQKLVSATCPKVNEKYSFKISKKMRQPTISFLHYTGILSKKTAL